MSARIAAFLLWAVAAACLVYWLMRVGVTPAPLPASVQPVATAVVLRGDVMRLFASPAVTKAEVAPVEPALASRFKLLGVVAPPAGERGAGEGIALIAVDGKPARPYRVGAVVDDSLVLQAVARRGATIGPAEGRAAVRLELPPLVPAATGSLPATPSFSPTTSPPPPGPSSGALEQAEQAEDFAPPAPDPLAPDPGPEEAQPADAAGDPDRRR